MLSTDTLKPACEKSINLLTYSSKWVDKRTYEKIKKDIVGCGELTAMLTVTKALTFSKITEGKCTRGSFS